MSEVTTEKTTAPLGTDEGDHERFTHYVPIKQLEDAIFNGSWVIALCGKKWYPHRDPNKFPLCPRCKEIYDALPED